jgi:hypothetical protein
MANGSSTDRWWYSRHALGQNCRYLALPRTAVSKYHHENIRGPSIGQVLILIKAIRLGDDLIDV